MNRRHLFLSIWVLAIASPSEAVERWKDLSGQWREAGDLESSLLRIMDEHDVTALSVAVVENERVVFQRTLGLVDSKSGKPVSEQTVFRAASLSKPVFAYLVMKMVDEGVIEIDRPLHEYLNRPLYEYPAYSSLRDDARYELLTVGLVLSHQSGFPNWRRMRPNGPIGFRFKPGEQFGYSGEGYRLLQFVTEEINSRKLNELAMEKVFSPLGMRHSSFLWEKRFDGDFAVELDSGIGRFIRKTRHEAVSAASLVTHAADYGQFLLAVMNGRGLKPETYAAMVEPRVTITSSSLFGAPHTDTGKFEAMGLSWALGWGTFQCPVGKALFHVGREEGCENYAVVFLDRRVGVVIQSLTTKYDTFTPRLLEEAIGDVYSPLDWLQYGTGYLTSLTMDEVLPVLVIVSAAALLSFALFRLTARRRRGP